MREAIVPDDLSRPLTLRPRWADHGSQDGRLDEQYRQSPLSESWELPFKLFVPATNGARKASGYSAGLEQGGGSLHTSSLVE
eukprot:scaffold186571_cov28-Tisochrysis_lutea.AAC.5